MSRGTNAMPDDQHIILTASTDLLRLFYQLLEQGFLLKAPVGCSVREFICRHLAVDHRYLEERVQTIFLDQKPVDDLDAAVISKEAVVALSAAMPGLAGATLRKGGRYAAMRNRISCEVVPDRPSNQTTTVVVKFFNIVARELGRYRFEQGIRIPSKNLVWFFKKFPDAVSAGTIAARINGMPTDPATIGANSWPPEVFLQITTDDH